MKRSGGEGGRKEREEAFIGGLEDVSGREGRGAEVELDAEAAAKLKVRLRKVRSVGQRPVCPAAGPWHVQHGELLRG